MTTNEATILGAVIGGGLTYLATKFAGPNYKKQLTELSQTHKEVLREFAAYREAEQKRHEASIWKPDVSLAHHTSGIVVSNELLLKSDSQFALKGVYLQTEGGVTLAELPVDKGISSTGFRVHIRSEDILKLTQNAFPNYGTNGRVPGKFAYKVSREGQVYEGSMNFTTEQVMIENTWSTKLLG